MSIQFPSIARPHGIGGATTSSDTAISDIAISDIAISDTAIVDPVVTALAELQQMRGLHRFHFSSIGPP